jgi:catechol 2,3-dioxygenase-like lactoylglutathione lyase family enzyme
MSQAIGSASAHREWGEAMSAKGGIHHVDIAVADPVKSIAFYLALLGPLGWREMNRYLTYRGTEEVVYLGYERPAFGIRKADGGAHQYYRVGVEHIAFEVEERSEVDEAHERCVTRGDRIHFPPQDDKDEPGYYAFFVFDPDGFRIEVFCWKHAAGDL